MRSGCLCRITRATVSDELRLERRPVGAVPRSIAPSVAGTAAFSTAFGLGALTGAALCGVAMAVFGPHGFPGSLLVVFAGYLVIQSLLDRRCSSAPADDLT